jgi:hypothetical protein
MKSENMNKLNDEQFRRITGVKRVTFAKMLDILQAAETERRTKGGPKPALSVEEMLLATLEYWREYRTYAHIAVGYGISESQMFRIIKWAENALIKDGVFSLPGKKTLLRSDVEYEVVLIDVAESPVERPKRGSENGIRGRKSDTR